MHWFETVLSAARTGSCRADEKLFAYGAGAASRCCILEPASYAAQLQEGVFPLKKTNSIRLSMQNFGNTHTLAICGMFLALKMVLGTFSIRLSNILSISFSFLAVVAAGVLFGPMVGGIFGAAGDILSYFLHPDGPFFLGFTLNAFLSGFLYGLILYKRPVKLWRAVFAKAVVTVLINFFLNPLWLSILYGKAFFAVMSVRWIAELIKFPVNTALLFFLLKLLDKTRITRIVQEKCCKNC